MHGSREGMHGEKGSSLADWAGCFLFDLIDANGVPQNMSGARDRYLAMAKMESAAALNSFCNLKY